MVIILLFVSVILFILADLGVREFTRKLVEKKKRRDREEALSVSLKLDFTHEARSLKRVEVDSPAARILCVDDEEVVLDSFRKILVMDGYSVDTVQTGEEALGLVQSHHYDFVFTDLKMPEMDGVDVVKSVKHLRPDIDVVIITGYATVETAVECMKFGAMDYVQKPFTESELLAFVKKALIRRQDRIQKQLKPQIQVVHMPAADRVSSREFTIPGGVFISKGHCWAAMAQDGSVKVGMDDFARKLIGKVSAIEFPNVGMTVKAGQPLFSVRQKNRSISFLAPVGGKVTRTNSSLKEDCGALDMTPYAGNWVCVIDSDSLEADTPALRIGKAAVGLFQDDIELFRKFLAAAGRDGGEEGQGDGELYIGELERLNDEQWEKASREFFARAA